MNRYVPLALSVAIACGLVVGCASKQPAAPYEPAPAPQYSRPLDPGQPALRIVTDPDRMPDLGAAYRHRDAVLVEAIDHSVGWFDAPSSQGHFPVEGITHAHARESVIAFLDVIETAPDEEDFVDEVRKLFDVYESVGWNGEGTVLFTGYYAPVLSASRTRTERFRYPLYRRPSDLSTEPGTGRPLGRNRSGSVIEPYPTRREIEEGRLLAGQELVWLDDPLSAYLVHVNGSAKLRLTTGRVIYVGYAGKTDREYASLGKAMIEAGLVHPDEVSLSMIRRVHSIKPDEVEALMWRNENYVFFQEYDGSRWPAVGVPVTAECSLATDKRIYPRGGVVLVDTEAVTFGRGRKAFRRFMVDQDTGGAIEAPGRADIFMGIGAGAEILAGGQHAEGRLFYLFLKPEFVVQESSP